MASPPGPDLLATFDCPRCGKRSEERFWGPCSLCRGELVARFGSAGGGAEVHERRFEPSMHVVPNHVATKD